MHRLMLTVTVIAYVSNCTYVISNLSDCNMAYVYCFLAA